MEIYCDSVLIDELLPFQKELEKFGLKPLKRKNAVKLLQHIYDELHPMVTDTESSFQETPTQPKATDPSHKNKQRSSRSASGSGSSSGSGGSDDGSDSEDEQTTIVEEMDQGIFQKIYVYLFVLVIYIFF